MSAVCLHITTFQAGIHKNSWSVIFRGLRWHEKIGLWFVLHQLYVNLEATTYVKLIEQMRSQTKKISKCEFNTGSQVISNPTGSSSLDGSHHSSSSSIQAQNELQNFLMDQNEMEGLDQAELQRLQMDPKELRRLRGAVRV